MSNAFVSGLQQLGAFLASLPRTPLRPLVLFNDFSRSRSVLPGCEAQQVAQHGPAALGGRVDSDGFLPGGTNLLLPLSCWQYFTKGRSRSVTLPLCILHERRPVSERALFLGVRDAGT